MPDVAGSRVSRSPTAWLQTAVALGAHTVAAGCLPEARSLLLAVPLCVVAMLVLGRLLRGRPLLMLTAGQLTGHSLLMVAAACTAHRGVHGAGTDEPHLLMVGAHVAALVLCRAVLGLVIRLVDQATVGAAELFDRLVGPVEPVEPVLPLVRPRTAYAPTPIRSCAAGRCAPVRGPPNAASPLAA